MSDSQPVHHLSQRQGEILLHMTGLDRSKNAYRNHYAAEEGNDSWADLLALAALGLVTGPHADRAGVYGWMSFFYTTDAGVAQARQIKRARQIKSQSESTTNPGGTER